MARVDKAIICLFLLTVADSQEQDCPGQTLISGPRYSLSFEQFSSSSDFSEDFRSFHAKTSLRNSWCPSSNQPLGTVHWLQVDFGVEVTIHNLEIGGGAGILFQFYLTEFSILYGSSADNLSAVLQPNSTNAMVFSRSSTIGISTTSLPQPLTTRVLRIEAVSFQGDVPCVTLEAIGCVLQPGPCVESVVSLSSNRTLLPLSAITASSETGNIASGVLNPPGQRGWCSDEGFSSALPSPYIILNFTQPVYLSHMISAGGDTSYVTEFSLDYKEEHGAGYTPYTLLTTKEAVFSTEDGDSAVHTFWNQPLKGVAFRFKIQNGVRNIRFLPIIDSEYCWNIDLFGCVESNQEMVSTTTQSLPASTTQSLPASTTQSLPASTTQSLSANTTQSLPATTEQESIATQSNEQTTDSQTIMTTTQTATRLSTGLIAGVSTAGVVLVLLIALMIVLITCVILKSSRKLKTIRMREVTYSEASGSISNMTIAQDCETTTESLQVHNTLCSRTTVQPVGSSGSYDYAYAFVNPRFGVATLSDKRQLVSTEGIDSEFKVTANAAYGRTAEQITREELVEFPSGNMSDNIAYLSTPYQSLDICYESHDTPGVNTPPMYGSEEVIENQVCVYREN